MNIEEELSNNLKNKVMDDYNRFHLSLLYLVFEADNEIYEKSKPFLFELTKNFNNIAKLFEIKHKFD